MTEEQGGQADDAQKALEPVDGKFVFEVDTGMRVRFNADGWVEEIGKGGRDDPLGTKLQGKPSSKRDDLMVRRYYDLYSRAIILEVYPDTDNDRCKADGLLLFKDLEAGSPMYDRVNLLIRIANTHFNMNMKPLQA